MAEKVFKGEKANWVARQTARGFRIAIHIGKDSYPVSGLLLKSENDVRKLVKGTIIFVMRTTVERRKTVKN